MNMPKHFFVLIFLLLNFPSAISKLITTKWDTQRSQNRKFCGTEEYIIANDDITCQSFWLPPVRYDIVAVDAAAACAVCWFKGPGCTVCSSVIIKAWFKETARQQGGALAKMPGYIQDLAGNWLESVWDDILNGNWYYEDIANGWRIAARGGWYTHCSKECECLNWFGEEKCVCGPRTCLQHQGMIQIKAERVKSAVSGPSRMNFYIENTCTWKTIKVAIRYLDMSGEWVSKCWWTLSPGQGFFLADGTRLETTNSVWYYYAESTDGTSIWKGTDDDARTRSCGGRSLSMKRKDFVDSGGNLYLRLFCNNESRPTPAPPRPRPTLPPPRPRPTLPPPRPRPTLPPPRPRPTLPPPRPRPTPNSNEGMWNELTHQACGFGGEGEENKDFLRWYDVSLDFCKDECSRMGDACFGYDFQYRRGRCRIFKREPTTVIDKEEVDCWLKQAQTSSAQQYRPAIVSGGSTSLNSGNAFSGMFQLKARGRNDCWSLRKGNTEEGTKIVTAKCDAGSESQHFRLDTMEEIFVAIRPRSAGGMYVVGKDVDGTLGPTPEEGTQGSLVLGDLSDKDTSYFTFAEPKERDGTTYYSIYMGEYAGENTLYVAFNKDEEGNAIGRGLKTRTKGRMEYVGSMDPGAKFHTEWEALPV